LAQGRGGEAQKVGSADRARDSTFQVHRLNSVCHNPYSGNGEGKHQHQDRLSHSLPTSQTEDPDLALIVGRSGFVPVRETRSSSSQKRSEPAAMRRLETGTQLVFDSSCVPASVPKRISESSKS